VVRHGGTRALDPDGLLLRVFFLDFFFMGFVLQVADRSPPYPRVYIYIYNIYIYIWALFSPPVTTFLITPGDPSILHLAFSCCTGSTRFYLGKKNRVEPAQADLYEHMYTCIYTFIYMHIYICVYIYIHIHKAKLVDVWEPQTTRATNHPRYMHLVV